MAGKRFSEETEIKMNSKGMREQDDNSGSE